MRSFGYLLSQPGDPPKSLKEADTREQALTEALDHQIPLWAASHGGKLSNMLSGSEVNFRNVREKFLDQVETHVQVTLAHMQGRSHRDSREDPKFNPGKEEASSSSADRVDVPVGTLYSIREISGKGQGMIAVSKIPKGTRILAEAPIFKVPKDELNIQRLERICIICEHVAKRSGRSYSC